MTQHVCRRARYENQLQHDLLHASLANDVCSSVINFEPDSSSSLSNRFCVHLNWNETRRKWGGKHIFVDYLIRLLDKILFSNTWRNKLNGWKSGRKMTTIKWIFIPLRMKETKRIELMIRTFVYVNYTKVNSFTEKCLILVKLSCTTL